MRVCSRRRFAGGPRASTGLVYCYATFLEIIGLEASFITEWDTWNQGNIWKKIDCCITFINLSNTPLWKVLFSFRCPLYGANAIDISINPQLTPAKPWPTRPLVATILSKGGGALGAEDLLARGLGDAVGERELEVLLEELLDVGALDVVGLLDLNNAEDVDGPEAGAVAGGHVGVEGVNGIGSRHLTELLVHVVSAGARVVADPDTEVLDLLGALLGNLKKNSVRPGFRVGLLKFLSVRTALTETISPVAFLTLRRPRKKYQKRDLATVVLGAKIVMRYMAGVGLASVGKWRPMTSYS